MLRLLKLPGNAKDGPGPAEHEDAVEPRDPAKKIASQVSRATQSIIEEGGRHFAAGRFAESLAVIDRALGVMPNAPELLFARGSALFGWGRFHEALQSYREAASAGLDHVDVDLQIGWSLVHVGRAGEAEERFRKAVEREPDSMTAYVSWANVLEMQGKLAPDADNVARGLSRWPESYDAVILLAACRLYQGDQDGGIAAFRRAIAIDPERPRAWSNLGAALDWSTHLTDALAACERAVALEEQHGLHGDSFINLATALREQGRWSEAFELIRRSLPGNPDVNGHWLHSIFLLESGQFDEGWAQHEFRWLQEPLLSRRWSNQRPTWAGQDLHGKTILLHAEQGFGDTIQFVRYAPALKTLGANVLFDSFKGFEEISCDFDGVDAVLREGDSIPHYDFHISLLSLPRIFGTDRVSVPANIPYVKVRPQYVEKWAKRMTSKGKLNVGLVWAGNPKHRRDKQRSVPLQLLKALGAVDGVQLFALQKGRSVEADIAASGLALINLDADLQDFRDTAAAITFMDLIISVDTSVAHLAGALGKPVWLMLPTPPDWRWLLDGDYTDWYPTMRLFRQREGRNWESVVEELTKALFERVKSALRVPIEPLHGATVRAPDGAPNVTPALPLQPSPAPGLSAVCESRYGIVQHFPNGPLAASLIYYGEYRQLELELIGRFLKPGSWVLQVGAGIGVDTLFLAAGVGEAGHVLAYESDPLLHQLARQNLAANRVRNVTLLRRRVGSGGAPGTERGANGGAAGVGADSVDSLRLARLDWIKMDSPSAGERVLAGAGDALWRFRPWIFMSVDEDASLASFLQLTGDFGYRSWRVKTPLFHPKNYACRSDDIFAGQFAFGVLCIPEEIDMDVTLEGCTPCT